MEELEFVLVCCFSSFICICVLFLLAVNDVDE